MQFKKLLGPDNQEKKFISIYDVEYKQAFDIDLNFCLIKDLDGLGQINFNNNLYFCGSPRTHVNTGSYLLRYDPKKPNNNTSLLITSIHNHYFPTIIGFKSEYLLVIGGELNLKCECYNLQLNKWKQMPDLPEERYKSNGFFDEESDTVYIVGGYDSFTQCNRNTILRLNLKNLNEWEILNVKKNSNLIARNSFAIIKQDKNSVMILGGIGNENEKYDNIIDLDYINLEVIKARKKLSKSATFLQSGGCDLNNTSYFLFDDEFKIHLISNNSFNIDIINYYGLN